jgi:hypothetical protein
MEESGMDRLATADGATTALRGDRIFSWFIPC